MAKLDLSPLQSFQGDVPLLLGFVFKGDRVESGLWKQFRKPNKKPPTPAEAAKVEALFTEKAFYTIDNNPNVLEIKIDATAGGSTVRIESRQGKPLSRTVRDPKTGKEIDESDPDDPRSQEGTPGDRVDYHGYLTKPLPAADLLTLLEAHAADPTSAQWKLDTLFFTVDMFWDFLLELMTNPQGESTLADPTNPKAKSLLDMIRREEIPTKEDVSKSPIKAKQTIEISDWVDLVMAVFDKPLAVLQLKVEAPPQPGLPPMVQVIFEIQFDRSARFTGPQAATQDHRDMRSLIACEWSAIARYARRLKDGDEEKMTPAQRIRLGRVVSNMANNIGLWLITHTDLAKGERILAKVVAEHKDETDPEQLGAKLREALDQRLVIANHWGANDEDLFAEQHQRILSDVFGTLQHKIALVSPVLILRTKIMENIRLTHRDWSLLALQYGVGHCQEHANVAFHALKGVKDAGNAAVTHIVVSGLSNIDHAFVIYNLKIGDAQVSPEGGVWVTKTTTASRPDEDEQNQITREEGPGKVLTVWNLQAAIMDSKIANSTGPNPDPDAKHGFILDPYLALPSKVNPGALTARTAEELLGRVFPRDANLDPSHSLSTPWVWVSIFDRQPVVDGFTPAISNAIVPSSQHFKTEAERAEFFVNV